MFDLHITASTVAWYAAVVGTIGMILNLFRFFKDRHRLVVSGFTKGEYNWEGNEFVVLWGVNTGKRPMTIIGAGFELNDGRNLVLDRDFSRSRWVSRNNIPRLVAEGDIGEVVIERKDLDALMEESQAEIKKGWLKDAKGKKWKCDFKLKH